MAHDVFVSHSSKDKPTADAVCAMLESQGIRCWVAPRDITPGMDWGEAIVEAVKGARVMVLVFSASANGSPQIKREVERAVNKGIPVIPLRIEDVAPTASLEYFISTPHWLDAFTPPLETHLRYLAQIIQQIVSAPRAKDSVVSPAGPVPGARTTAEPPAENQPAAEIKTRRPVRPIGFITAAAALLALLLAGWWFGIERPRREESQRQLEAERKTRIIAELEAARLAEEQGKMRAEMDAARRAEEQRQKTAAAAKFADEQRQADLAARQAVEKQEAEKAAKLAQEKQMAEANAAAVAAAEAARIAAAKKEPDAVPIKTALAENQNGIQSVREAVAPEPSAMKKPPTVFELVQEANRSLGEESKGNLFYARSERSVGELTPSIWKLGFYDPATMLKVTELRFRSGTKSDVTRPAAVLEMYNPQKILDPKKLNVDSDRALQTAAKDPSLKNLTLRTSEMKLESMDGLPVWRIKLWARRIRNPSESAEVGEIWISSDDGKVIRSTLNPRRAE